MVISKRVKRYIDSRIEKYIDELYNPKIPIYILPGGKMPKRKTKNANAFDIFLRALVSPDEMDENNPIVRKLVFNFKDIPDKEGDQFSYQLNPGESILAATGFITDMKFPVFYQALPRSGLVTKSRIDVPNAMCPIDSDYRGEAGILLSNNSRNPILLTKNMRVGQALFQRSVTPRFVKVRAYEELTATKRGVGGFGSTGIR